MSSRIVLNIDDEKRHQRHLLLKRWINSFYHSTFRHFGHLLRYCEPAIRRAVPLALGLISVSNPQLNILDTLTKFSHDTDTEVAHNSIFALGLIGAGKLKIKLFLFPIWKLPFFFHRIFLNWIRVRLMLHFNINILFKVPITQGLLQLWDN